MIFSIQKDIFFHGVLRGVTFLCVGAIQLFTSCSGNERNFYHELKEVHADLYIENASFEKSHLKESLLYKIEKSLSDGSTISSPANNWELALSIDPINNDYRAFTLRLKAICKEDMQDSQTIAFRIHFKKWATQNYILFPGAVYNGNRYHGRAKKRKEQLWEATSCYTDMEPFITDAPRLNIAEGPSSIQLLSGDMSMPALAIQFSSLQKGILMVTEQGTPRGDYSFKLEEKDDRSEAFAVIRMPGVREDSCFMGRRSQPSPDRAIVFRKGDTLNMSCKIFFFDAPSIPSVYDALFHIRKETGGGEISETFPYSAAWNLLEKKYNRQNWVENHGYYSVGMRENPYQDWQTGWTGGMNAVYPLLLNGDETTRQRALKTFDFLFDSLTPSGFLFDVYHQNGWFDPYRKNFLRRNSDALYFILKSFFLYNKLYPNNEVPEKWENSTQTCADAFVKLYKTYGQLGQWIDNQTGAIVAGGSASNGIACAALSLCSQYFENKEYLMVAEQLADYYYTNFILKGLTNGGPGDVWQCPDSESAFGLLESFVVLYETTRNAKYLIYAEATARQCASWVVPYNFRFPENSTFAKMGMQTTGTVIANVNNKHSAPGICTLSGNSLFKLFRYSGNEMYLEIIRDISKTIPQYMSRSDRPIPDIRPEVPVPVMPPGWINERVNMSDWEERGNPGDIKRGEIFGGSCWSEVSCMLSYAEIPGLYIIPDQERMYIFDHIQAEITERNDSSLLLTIKNPTHFDADIRVLIENSKQMKSILPSDYLLNSSLIHIPRLKEMQYKILKSNCSLQIF